MSGQKIEQDKVQPSKPLSRNQRRDKERRELEAKGVYESLCKKFFDHFIKSNEPDGFELEVMRKQINTQWKVYCNRASLIPDAYKMFDEYSLGLIKEYKDTKEGVQTEHALSQSEIQE